MSQWENVSMEVATEAVSSRAVVLAMLQDHVVRLNHIEQLLLGMATLAVAGWGFFYATQSKGKTGNDKTAALGRTSFALVFSGLVGSAFNSLYIGRMGINLSLLKLEEHLAPTIKPYLTFMIDAGLMSCLLVFAVPALFMPLLALGAIGFSWLDARRVVQTATRQRIVTALAILVSVPVLFTTISSIRKVLEVIFFALTKGAPWWS